MKKFLFFFTVCLLFNVYASAQTKTVTGTVISRDDNSGIPGATVLVNETKKGVAADIDGKYSIQVAKGQTLVFSAIGYEEQSIVVGDENQINVTLSISTTTLSESVIVGYGVQRKENLTGAVASVNVEKTLASRPIADVGRGLQGAVPGLSVVVASGEIGSDPIMRIRGQVSAIEGTAKPLILMDNVEIPSIQLINPDDIESISVLKDAASTSIYGAKAAFGVVLITTKKGAKTESVRVSYSSNYSWQNRAKDLDMAGIDGMQYALDATRTRHPEDRRENTFPGTFWKISETSIEQAKEWQKKYGSTIKTSDPLVYGRDWYYDQAANQKFSIRTYDVLDLLVKEWTPTFTQNLSVTGLSGKTSYHLGIGMLNQTGMNKAAKIDDFKRYNTSLNISTEINKYVTLRGGFIYSDRNKRFPSIASYIQGDPWLYAYRWGASFPVTTKDQFGNDMRGPAYEFANTTTSSNRSVYTNINLGATVTINKDWDVKFDYTHVTQNDIEERSLPTFFAYDTWGSTGKSIVPWTNTNGDFVYVDNEGNIVADGGMPAYRFTPVSENGYHMNGGTTSYISRKSINTNSNVFNVYTTYNLNLNENHEIKVMTGMNSVTQDDQNHYARRDTLTNFTNPQFNFATGTQLVEGSSHWEAQLGFFGRVNYTFKNKYLVEANLRYDGSSKFPKGLKWQWFPSASAGWIVSKENFMENIKNIISFAKIRVSYGSIGDQSVSSSLYVPQVSVYSSYWMNGDNRNLAYKTPDAVSGDISWQNIVTLDFGIDLRFWQNRIGLTFDWYRRDTKDMIIPGDAVPYTFGTGAPKGNYGNLRTNGWEIAFDFNYRFQNGLGINGTATLSDATTRITKGADYLTPWGNRLITSEWATGATYGDIWGYVTDRLYQESDFVYGSDGKIRKVTIRLDGNAKESYMLAGTNPVYQTFLEGGDGVQIFRPGDVKFVDLNGDGYITPGSSTFGDPGDKKVIGNSTPRYQYGFKLGADWKGFDFSIFFQGVGARKIWGSGQLAIPGYNADDGAMPQAIAGNYWRPDRTDAFYPKPWNNATANTNYSLQVQSRYLLNMAYLRIKNITFGYTLPEKLMKKILLTGARVYVSLENFFTFDNLRGLPIDPEAQTGYSMFQTTSYNLTRTGTGTPTFKSASAGIQLSF
ncbi:MAG: SusC/RagA family TonB-linked outer membrane protein [Prevotellaceae bacterium]|jgi:TonB-linked SusC/RagA family outer membrane protein|nr:SusC/RagA family TonB-linked outer membrane protein [Prevotellaceae bacterium]